MAAQRHTVIVTGAFFRYADPGDGGRRVARRGEVVEVSQEEFDLGTRHGLFGDPAEAQAKAEADAQVAAAAEPAPPGATAAGAEPGEDLLEADPEPIVSVVVDVADAPTPADITADITAHKPRRR